MDLVKKTKEIKIENEEFVMCFDMESIVTYKELTGENFNRAIGKLFSYEDKTLLNFIASTLRRKSEPSKPLREEVLNGDILYFLLNHTVDVIDLVANSLPDNKGSKKK